MSRIGKKPVVIPANVTVNVAEGNVVTVKGPKGELTNTFNADMIINVEGNVLTVSRPTDEANHRALHGLTRTLISNMVEGVEKGFSKELEVNGVGYRVEKKGTQLVMRLGYSHEVIVDEIPGITIEVPTPNKIIINGVDKGFAKELEINGVGYRADKKGNQLVMRLGFSHEVFVEEIPGINIEVNGNKITIRGIDKQAVGQFAAEVRSKRPPEPYKGKGIKYTTEVIRRKVGKTGGKK